MENTHQSHQHPNTLSATQCITGYRSWRLIIPSSLTCLNLMLGFYSIIASSEGNLRLAASLIFAGILIDILDGWCARLLHATSHFGKELDSLADIVTFGTAPACMMYRVGLSSDSSAAELIAFLPLLGAALRLARFNTESRADNFCGLPSPGSAALLAGYVMLGRASLLEIGTLSVAVCLLMVSNIAYPSTQWWAIMVIVMTLLVTQTPFIAALCYALLGTINTVLPRVFFPGSVQDAV